jgi:hypothetical protein
VQVQVTVVAGEKQVGGGACETETRESSVEVSSRWKSLQALSVVFAEILVSEGGTWS